MAKLIIRTKGLPAEVIELKKGINRLGRSSANDFQIQHDTISRFHCEIEVRDDGMFVRDVDSSNGTLVNNQPVESAQLHSGNFLRLGYVSMEVTNAPEPITDALPMCSIHPNLSASMICTQCRKVFCGTCVHILKRTDGNFLRLCPECSGHCEPIKTLVHTPKKSVGSFIKKLFKKESAETQRFHKYK